MLSNMLQVTVSSPLHPSIKDIPSQFNPPSNRLERLLKINFCSNNFLQPLIRESPMPHHGLRLLNSASNRLRRFPKISFNHSKYKEAPSRGPSLPNNNNTWINRCLVSK